MKNANHTERARMIRLLENSTAVFVLLKELVAEMDGYDEDGGASEETVKVLRRARGLIKRIDTGKAELP